MENNISLENVRQALVKDFQSLHDTINEALKGTDFKVGIVDVGFFYTTVELTITKDGKEQAFNCSRLVLRLDEDDFKTKEGRKFTTNIGTTGEFDLDDTDICSRNNFYINVGKLLGNKEMLGNIRKALEVHSASICELRKKIYELKKEA